jgi:hypothetical protein
VASTYKKQPCRCGHGKAIHEARRIDEKMFHSPCNHPGCRCRDYKLVKTRASTLR